VVIVSGDIGVHGVAIMSVGEGLQFGTDIESDTQPLIGLVATTTAFGASRVVDLPVGEQLPRIC
jgi:hydrogenase expression/formation protein HypE